MDDTELRARLSNIESKLDSLVEILTEEVDEDIEEEEEEVAKNGKSTTKLRKVEE